MANFNTLQALTHISLAGSGPHDITGTFNTAFNSFILPQQIQAVSDKLPPLSVSVGNLPVTPGANALFVQKNGLPGTQSPLWLLEQGNVPVAVAYG